MINKTFGNMERKRKTKDDEGEILRPNMIWALQDGLCFIAQFLWSLICKRHLMLGESQAL